MMVSSGVCSAAYPLPVELGLGGLPMQVDLPVQGPLLVQGGLLVQGPEQHSGPPPLPGSQLLLYPPGCQL